MDAYQWPSRGPLGPSGPEDWVGVMTLGWLAISGKGASVTFDTNGLLVEVATGVEGEEGVDCGDEDGGSVVGEEEVTGLSVFVVATERRPELS